VIGSPAICEKKGGMSMVRSKQIKRKKGCYTRQPDPGQQNFASSLLKNLEEVGAEEVVAGLDDARQAEALVETLSLDHPAAMEVLKALSAKFAEKPVQKAIRKVLYRLKKKGVPVEGFYQGKQDVPAVFRMPERGESSANIGPVLADGYRAVVMNLHRGMKGVQVCVGLVSDEEGIQEFLCGDLNKKRTREIREHISEKAGPLVETSLSHAVTVLEAGYRTHLKRHPEVPPHYMEVRPWLLARVGLLDRPLIYHVMPEETISREPLTNSQMEKLFLHEWMTHWLIDFAQIRPMIQEIVKVQESPIVLSEVQKSERVREIKEKHAEKVFSQEKRAVWKNRFEETAYLFFKRGEEDLARLSLSAAHMMDEEDTRFTRNPLIQFLIDRTLSRYTEIMKETAQEESTIQETSSRILFP